MLRIRESRAFTMIELIVVVVILGILAGIAAVSYNAVIDRSKTAAKEQTGVQVDHELLALAAFDNKAENALTQADIDKAAPDFKGDLVLDSTAGTVTVTGQRDASAAVGSGPAVGTLTLGTSPAASGTFVAAPN